MSIGRLARWRRSLEALFPERHLYVRSGGEMRAFTLTTGRQLSLAAAIAAAALWMGLCTAAMLVGALNVGTIDKRLMEQKAYFERLNADRQARLNSAIVQLSDGSIAEQAEAIDRRQEALIRLFTDMSGSAPTITLATEDASPVDKVRVAQQNTEHLIDQVDAYAKSRGDRLRLALRMAGLNPSAYSGTPASGLGGPLVDAKDPHAVAAILDVDEDFAQRIMRAYGNTTEVKSMSAAIEKMPLGKPTVGVRRASGYGRRIDPFTRSFATHTGLDFAGARMTPIYATGPGVVSFTGVRSGYGNTIEIDHGGGFKTRYGHLAAISVARGQRVAVNQRIGGMGSTGRSTGPHLHYEVWVGGSHKNPDQFLRAGDYVQQTN